ncbi:MAG: cytochrome c oxidase subunit 3 [Planctomycetota bacterium]
MSRHPTRLRHHFDTLPQQFEASKLGMWLFLATEVLLFGGLFCGYAVYRGNHPDIFHYGSRFLDTTWGAINTVVLILSSVTMAIAVSAAQRDLRAVLVACLALTFGGGAVFMGVKYVEYRHKFHDHLVPGTRFYEDPHPGAEAAGTGAATLPGDARRGKVVWAATCRSCHGQRGEGVPGQGRDIRESVFVAQRNDGELLAFVKVGRMPFDPLNTTGVQMPPKGGNPLLNDQSLLDAIAFLRTLAAPEGGAEPAAAPPGDDAALRMPRSSIPDAPAGPPGVDLDRLEELAPEANAHPVLPSRDPDRPPNAHMFFVFYFLMTGLHGLHVLAGMAVMAWLLVRALRGHFGAAYFTPVDLGGLYWHVVDLIWIFLFPLFYLIK